MGDLRADEFEEFAAPIRAFVVARAKLDSETVRLITVDGEHGAGKTTFAAALAEYLGATHVELDGYLRPRSKPDEKFIDLVNLAGFTAAVREPALVVADGVLISDILVSAELESDHSIYVKRISEYGFWHYGLDLERGRLVEMPEAPPSKLDEEVFEYHLRRLPHECANSVFHRIG